jgi:hypothetical protein
MIQWFTTVLSKWWQLPMAARGLTVMLAAAAVYFAMTSTRARARSAPKNKLGDALSGLVKDAADAAKRAGSAPTPYHQLLHVQWGLASLNAARAVAKADAGSADANDIEHTLSAASAIHVGRLSDYLTKAQALCSERLEAATVAQA